MATEQQIRENLSQYRDPLLKEDLVEAKALKNIELSDGEARISIKLGFPLGQYKQQLEQDLTDFLTKLDDSLSYKLDISWRVDAHVHPAKVQAMPNVKNIIAVASGKGGVGKSTTSVNLALALSALGANVGILDADIYGPSMPIMLGTQGKNPETLDKKSIMPIESLGLQSMSIGYLVKPEQAMVWRGPMASGALQQLINDTQWKDLDYLIIDLPPGTGDIQLTMAQKIPVTASVVVTTPQDIALADARKAVTMFNKVSVPVLGVVENMATHTCSNCGHEEHIFGQGGGDALAKEIGVELLGSLPLSLNIREQTDAGEPTVVKEPESEVTQRYLDIAQRMAAKLSLESKDFKVSFPSISIENT
ncbi:iron-sulfur cluster carrier protein ApbC [Kangiella sediminilitoris]|uniref:Iron-sulfur cluster carrier protein n=1 Tax=Kangiella sediminilitoris TaxID=1144748 RepID=A0A1B3BBG3_9GAMM|nr:iron-sulfur cluster carrier protein ApbC [Kangiella sediminilitoris]AOE50126.1 ATP-binding protein [Kangiella sediminilitoris]